MITERVDPEEIVRLYEEKNVTPMTNDYISYDNGVCACGLGMYYLDRCNVEITPSHEFSVSHTLMLNQFFALHFGNMYMSGFTNGFDGRSLENLVDDLNFRRLDLTNERLLQGHADGVKTFNLLLERGLITDEET